MTGISFEKLISDEARQDLGRHGVDLRQEVRKLFRQISEKDYRGIKKLQNTRKPLYRKRMSDNTRLIFDFGDGWIRLWKFDKRKDVYRNLPEMSRQDPLYRIYGYDLSGETEEMEGAEIRSGTAEKFENYPGVRFYSVPGEEYIRSDELFRSFIEREYEYYVKLAGEQSDFITELIISHKNVHLVQGAAGSGKTICGAEYAYQTNKNCPGRPVIFLVPTERLAIKCTELLRRKDPASVYVPGSSGTEITWQDVTLALETCIVVFTFTQFYELCFARKFPHIPREKYSGSEKKIQAAIKEYALRHHEKKFSKIPPARIYQIYLSFRKNEAMINRKNNITDHCFEDLSVIEESLPTTAYEAMLCDISGKHRRLFDKIDMVREIREDIDAAIPPELKDMCIILDEAQDLLSEEWKLFADIYKKRSINGTSKLVMFGDMNQRVAVTDFDWSRVREYFYNMGLDCEHIELKNNYRSTREICRFSQDIMSRVYGNVYNRRGSRWLPTLADPERCAGSGAVPTLIVGKLDALTGAIKRSATKNDGSRAEGPFYSRWIVITGEKDENRILSALAEEVEESTRKVLVLPPSLSKGEEFDTVVMLNPVPLDKEDIIGITAYYTGFTRARRNLLLFFEPDRYRIFREYGFEEDGYGAFIFKNFRQEEIDDIFRRAGSDHIEADRFASIVRQQISGITASTGHAMIEQILSGIEEILNRSDSSFAASDLLSELYNRASLSRKNELKKIVEARRGDPLKALYEKISGNMLNSVRYWMRSGYYRNEACRTIDELEAEADIFETVRSASLSGYSRKLEDIRTQLRGRAKRSFDILKQKAEEMPDAGDAELFFNIIGSMSEDIRLCMLKLNEEINPGGNNGGQR